MKKVNSEIKCSVVGCKENAVRAISAEKTRLKGLDVVAGKKAYLCNFHYKQFKKNSKKEKMIERWRWDKVGDFR
ncbi:MAG: hypothetical protein ACKD6N_04340 [Candidatus Bathyarchaeota archaeon]